MVIISSIPSTHTGVSLKEGREEGPDALVFVARAEGGVERSDARVELRGAGALVREEGVEVG